MIITKLQGGLGNQLFQWAITLNLSIKYNTDYFFETTYFENSRPIGVFERYIEINKFSNINIPIENNEKNLRIVYDNYTYQNIENNSYLIGYWQNEKYFEENSEIIREKLKISEKYTNFFKINYPYIFNENNISLHVRRGDYINLSKYHPIQNIQYYESAFDIINNKFDNLLIFSDDIEWCKTNFKFPKMKFIESNDNIVDLYLMSLCQDNIIANSSYSWWGAWLNPNKNKKIIAPKLWHNMINTDDVIPLSWIKI